MTPEVREWFRSTGRDLEVDEDGSALSNAKRKLKSNSKEFEAHENYEPYKAFVTAGHAIFKSFKKQAREASGKSEVTQKEFLYWSRNIRFNSEEVNRALIRLYDNLKKPKSILDNIRERKFHVRILFLFLEVSV